MARSMGVLSAYPPSMYSSPSISLTGNAGYAEADAISQSFPFSRIISFVTKTGVLPCFRVATQPKSTGEAKNRSGS